MKAGTWNVKCGVAIRIERTTCGLRRLITFARATNLIDSETPHAPVFARAANRRRH